MPIASNSARRGPIASSSSAAPGNSPAGSVRVAGEHEQLAHAGAEQPVEHLVQVGAVAHEARRDVRHHRVAGAGEALGQVERRLEAACAARP